VVVSDYNVAGTGRYRSHYSVPKSSFQHYIHVRDQAPPTPPPPPSPPGGTNPDHTVSGDFNRDGYADVVAFYGYAGARTRAWLFRGNPNGVDTPLVIWDSGAGQWNWDQTKLVSGDFNRDGYADVVAFYGYAGARTRAWLFRGNPNGVSVQVIIWDSGPGQWDWNRM
jgi:hypothetical protein